MCGVLPCRRPVLCAFRAGCASASAAKLDALLERLWTTTRLPVVRAVISFISTWLFSSPVVRVRQQPRGTPLCSETADDSSLSPYPLTHFAWRVAHCDTRARRSVGVRGRKGPPLEAAGPACWLAPLVSATYSLALPVRPNYRLSLKLHPRVLARGPDHRAPAKAPAAPEAAMALKTGAGTRARAAVRAAGATLRTLRQCSQRLAVLRSSARSLANHNN